MNKFQRYTNFIMNVNHTLKPKNNLFILSHMRSTSSLLSHILSDNDQICGHVELHSPYTKYVHQIKTRSALYMEKDSFKNSTYLLDKILHNRLVIDERTFKITPKYIFLLREPERTMISMISMHIRHNNPVENIKVLEEYYINRVNTLIENWKSYNGDKIFIQSESLKNDTNNTLSNLSEFLELKSCLKDSYKIYNETGKAGYGDPSSNIKQGKILKSTPVDENSKRLLFRLDMDRINNLYFKATHLFSK